MISADQWRAYNEAVDAVCDNAREEVSSAVSSWLAEHPGATVAEAREEAKRVMRGAVQRHDQAAAALAAEWYDSQGRAAGAGLDRAVTEVVYTAADVDKLARYQAGRLVEGDVGGFAKACGDFAVDNAKRSLNATILRNAKRDRGRGVRFARVTSGRNTCSFCLMLAGRGAVYWSRETAGAFNHWHTHCSCKIVPGYSGNAYDVLVEGHDPAKIEARLEDVERLTGTERGTPEFTREVALRDPDWLFGDEIAYEIAKLAEPDDSEREVASILASGGIKPVFQPRSLSYMDRRADTLINGEKWEFKNPQGNGKLTVYNQFKSVVYGKNKHERNPQASNLVISNVRCEMDFEKMVSDVESVMSSGEFPEIKNVLVVSKDGKIVLKTKSH